MTDIKPSPKPSIADLQLADLGAALDAGIRDFLRAPQFGLFFSAVYVLAGVALLWLGAGHLTWILTASLAFPLFAPFAAVGLYEVSRRMEAGQPLKWGEILGVVWAERGRQVPWIGAIIVMYLLFYSFFAHMLFAMFMGLEAVVNVSESYEMFLTPRGLVMIAVEMIVGAVLGFLLFSLTVVSLPYLLDKEVDFVTAMLTSLDAVRANPVVMVAWAGLIGCVSIAAMVPWFLGLFVVLPVFGHATWHLYTRLLLHPAALRENNG